MSKTAVILFNLGGPDSLKAVRPFLFRLFNDKSIISLPQPLRFMAAQAISLSRARKAQDIYRHMGDKSPILELTAAQSASLEKELAGRKDKDGEFKVFFSMRHWHPKSAVVAKKVKAYAPDRIILLPLYPHYSTTTTGSSFTDWQQTARRAGLNAPTRRICCYPTDLGFVAAHVKLIRDMYWKATEQSRPRVLFSAHGLPKKIIGRGDPYQWQIEQTVAAITQVLAIDELDHRISYQSRVGPLEWIGPSTEEEIIQAGKDQVPLLVVPIAFVSEHAETLVELDIDYRRLAETHRVPGYWRVPALGTEKLFIEALADLCLANTANDKPESTCSNSGKRLCPSEQTMCPCAMTAAGGRHVG